jgi:RHS repeat-associated protein
VQGGGVDIKFSTPFAGSGGITLTASRFGVSDSGWYNVTVDGTTPEIRLLAPSGDVGVQYPTIQLAWCDDNSLDPSRRGIRVNAVDKTSSFDYVANSGPADCTVKATSTTNTVALNMGSNTVGANICDLAGNCAFRTFSITRVSYGVAVTPDGATAPARAANTSGHSETFTVQNTGTAENTYSLSCGGSANLTCTGLTIEGTSVTSVKIGAGIATPVTASFSVGAVGTGTLTLTASGTNASDIGSYSVPVFTPTPQPPVVDVSTVNPGTFIARDLCLTVAAGAAGAYECGDLRLVHALPTTRTLSKARTPTLLYNSQTAHPYPLVAANVTLPSVAAVPDSVTGTVTIGGVTRARARWPGSQWAAGQTRRVTLGFDALNDATGIYSYTLEIRNWYPDPATSQPRTVNGEVLVVNRSSSPFGAGWWLAGFEQFLWLADGRRMVVGGDGTVRVYAPVGGGLFVAANPSRPDTLNGSGADYIRIAPHGIRVQFSGATGKHIATINRLGHRTDFAYDGCGRLSTITLPPSGSGRVYTFTYTSPTDCMTQLASVTAPPADGASRVTVLTITGGRITAIRDPDNVSVGYGYDPGFANRVISRTDRRGFTTRYRFDAAAKLAADSFDLGAGQTPIVTLFRALEGYGLAAAIDTALGYTRLDGPRVDVADTTAFWLDRFGAPRRIVNALGHEILIKREDARWPALATEVRSPNGFVTRATYDARGNVLTTTAVNPLGDGRDAVTRYHWDARWDFTDSIVTPMGVVTTMAFDATNGNRLWQEDGRGTSSRETFDYYTSGSGAGLVKSVTVPGGAKDSLGYDAQGNLNATRTPLGWLTYFDNDLLGRTTVVRTQIAGEQWRRDSSFYDVNDQIVRTVAYGPPVGGALAESVHTRSFYNAERQLDSLQRWSAPDQAQVGTITTRWRYDLAGRRVAEVASDGMVDSTRYDAGGNATTVVTRRGHTLTMVYDGLGRLRQRIVPPVTYNGRYEGIATYQLNFNGRRPYPWYPTQPASPLDCQTNAMCYQDSTQWTLTIPGDTATLVYDAMGNLIRADNSAALIRRAYFTNGVLKADTLKIRSYSGADTVQHVYGIEHRYDLAGRRIVVKHPWPLAPRVSGAVKDSVRYLFDPVTGALQTLYDPLDSAFQFTYNLRNERIRLDLPGAIFQYQGYDVDGQLVADTIKTQSQSTWAFPYGSLLRQTRLHYADAQRVDTAANALGRQDTTTAAYSGLGHLVRMEWRQPAATAYGIPSRIYSTERFSLDALGNAWSKFDSTNAGWRGGFGASGTQTIVATHATRFAPLAGQQGTGRMRANADYYRTDSVRYDAAGNTVFSSSTRNYPNVKATLEDRAYFYGADGQLRVSEYRSLPWDPAVVSDLWDWRLTADEYRYDALGRRVLVRTRRTCRDDINQYAVPCGFGTMRRTVWDGAQELYEIQMFQGWGRVDGPPDIQAENDTALVFMQPPTFPAFWDPNRKLGRVAYTHGPGLDEPLSVTRINFVDYPSGGPRVNWAPLTIVPHWNWRGHADYGTMGDGGRQTCLSPSSSRCVSVAWSSKHLAFVQQAADTGTGWWGTLLDLKEDGTGTFFRRNRYMDPATGRFTQEDPIGLAGGLNLYGFAGGDPVTFSDPFGLCQQPKGLKEGQVGICIETFINGPSRGVPKWAADNRSFSATGGSYKTSDRFIVDPGSGAVLDDATKIGKTGPFHGIGTIGHSSGEQFTSGVTTVGAIANARTLSPWPPFNINYSLALNVGRDGTVSVSGSHDGFPSLEIWVYRQGQAPQLIYQHRETNVLDLRGCCDVKVP